MNISKWKPGDHIGLTRVKRVGPVGKSETSREQRVSELCTVASKEMWKYKPNYLMVEHALREALQIVETLKPPAPCCVHPYVRKDRSNGKFICMTCGTVAK